MGLGCGGNDVMEGNGARKGNGAMEDNSARKGNGAMEGDGALRGVRPFTYSGSSS
jgi:hypothetical protein